MHRGTLKTGGLLREIGQCAQIYEGGGAAPAVQWLRHHTSNTGDMGLIPGEGTTIPRAVWWDQKIFKQWRWQFSTNSPFKEEVGGQIEELSLNQRELSLKMGRETWWWLWGKVLVLPLDDRLSFEVVCYSRVYRRRNRLREGPTFTAEQSYFWIIWLFLNSCSPPPPLPLCYLRQEINELGFLLSEGGNTTLTFPRGKLFQHYQTICYLGKQKDSPGPLKSPTWRKVTWKKVFLKEWLEDMDRRPRFWPLLAMWLISFKIFTFFNLLFYIGI